MSSVPDGGKAVYFNLCLEPSVGTTIGYVDSKHIPFMKRTVMFSGELNVPVAKFDFNDYRMKAGAKASLYEFGKWDLSVSASAIARGTKNSIFRAFNLGADVNGYIGYYGSRWFAAAEIGYDKGMFTHISHSGWYKTNFYSDAKDGWYGNSAGSFRYGFCGGYTVGSIEIIGRLGMQRTEANRDMMPPFFGSLGVAYHL